MANDKNIFARVYSESILPKAGNLYGGDALVEEYEVTEAYIAYAEAAAGFQYHGTLYAEAAGDLMEKEGLSELGAFLYAEAEGGFFKRIVDALVKLWTKAKDFVIKLLGRFKSTKSYRADIEYIRGVLTRVSFTANNVSASTKIQVKKHKYTALLTIIMNLLSAKNTFVNGDFNDAETAGKSKSVMQLIPLMKGVIKKLNLEDKTASLAETEVNDIREALNVFQTKGPTSEILLRNGLKIVTKGIGEAEFKDSDTPQASIQNLWVSKSDTLEGFNEINEYFQKLKDIVVKTGNTELKYDDIEEGLTKGAKFFTNKIDELKSLLADIQAAGSKVNTSTNTEDAENKKATSNLVAISTQFSAALTNLSSATVTSYNLAKVQLDRLLPDLKSVCGQFDKLYADKKESGLTNKTLPTANE